MTPPNSLEVQRHALDYWQIIRNRLGLIFLCFLLVTAAAVIITYIMPPKYRGRVEMVIQRSAKMTDVVGQETTRDPLNVVSDNNFKTQFETLTKARVLERVAEKLDLMKVWNLPSAQLAAAKIRANLDPQSQIRSDFVTIEYYDENPELAAQIANAVVESYRETRIELDDERIDIAVIQLKEQVAQKEIQTDQARAKMLQIKAQYGIVESPDTAGASRMQDFVKTVDDSTLVSAAYDVYRLKKEISEMRTQVGQLQMIEGDDLIRQAGELRVENTTIRELGPKYQSLQLEQQRLAGSGLGRKHPDMQSIARQIEQARSMLLDAAQDYRKNLVFRMDTAEKSLAEMEKLNQNQKSDTIKDQSEYQEFLKVKKDWALAEKQLNDLKETLEQRQVEKSLPKNPVTVYQKAEKEGAPAKPKKLLYCGVGAVIGLLIGFGIAFFLEYMDTSVKSIDDVERLLGVPVLGVIPKNVGVLHRTTGMNPDAEAYRILRTNIEFNRKDPNANIISVVSGGAGEGKSTTMVNLATVCAQGGYTTLIIDGDLRRPRMHTFFDIPNSFGLSNFLTTNVSLEEVVVQTPVENLYFMPSGIMPADGAGLLNSNRFTDMLADVKRRFDVVLIDSPPILGVSDASVLAAEADMTLIVVQHRKLPRQMLQRVKHSVEGVGGRVLGVVLNNVDVRSDATYGYYTNYYSYYSGDGRGDASMKPAAKRSSKNKAVSSPGSPTVAASHSPSRDDDVF